MQDLIGKKVYVKFKSGEYAVDTLNSYSDTMVHVIDIDQTDMQYWSKTNNGFSTGTNGILDIAPYGDKIDPEYLLL